MKNRTKRSNPSAVSAAKKEEAIQYIKSAMTVLCDCAKDGDTVAKESIANLGVVLFDLQ